MAITLYGDRINFNGYGDQYISKGTTLDAIGCYIVALCAYSWNGNINDSISGEWLRYNFAEATAAYTGLNAAGLNKGWVITHPTGYQGWGGGGSSLSGTWRKMSSGTVVTYTYHAANGYTPAYYRTGFLPHLWLRIY